MVGLLVGDASPMVYRSTCSSHQYFQASAIDIIIIVAWLRMLQQQALITQWLRTHIKWPAADPPQRTVAQLRIPKLNGQVISSSSDIVGPVDLQRVDYSVHWTILIDNNCKMNFFVLFGMIGVCSLVLTNNRGKIMIVIRFSDV